MSFIAVYIRVSTEDQAEKGFSIPEQLEQCRAKAKQLSDDPIKEYIDDGHTGEFVSRPALNKLFDDADKGLIHTVVCLSIDRLSRNALTYRVITDTLDKKKINLQYVSLSREASIEGQLAEGVLANVAEYHKKKILSDTARGRRGKAKQGRVLRDFEVYGYNYDKETEKFIINDEEAKIVYEIWERYCIKEHSFNSIAKSLTERGIPTKKGKGVWHRQVVRQILTQEAYTGIFHANKWNTEGMGLNKFRTDEKEKVRIKLRPREEWIPIECPPIVPKEWLNITLQKINDTSNKYKKARVGKYLCSRLLHCAICGNTMSGFQTTAWGRQVFVYSCEKNYAGAKNHGCKPARRIPIHKIDQLIEEKIVQWLNNPELIEEQMETDKTTEESIMQIQSKEKELEKLKKYKMKLIRLLAEDEDSDIEDELAAVKKKEKDIIAEKENLELKLQISQSESLNISRRELFKNLADQYLVHRFSEFPPETKNEIARLLIKEITVPEEVEDMIIRLH